jgi:hypothetical protein
MVQWLEICREYWSWMISTQAFDSSSDFSNHVFMESVIISEALAD